MCILNADFFTNTVLIIKFMHQYNFAITLDLHPLESAIRLPPPAGALLFNQKDCANGER